MNKLKKVYILLGSFCLLIVSVATVLLLVEKRDSGYNSNFISNGDIVFTHIDNSISLGDVVPTLDKFGVLNEALSFSIKNIADTPKRYTLKLVDEKSTIKNSFIRYQLTKNGVVVGIYSLNNDGVIDSAKIDANEEISYAIRLWLDYQSDAKIGTVDLKINITEEDLKIEEKINEPLLVEGMIPVYYDESKMSFIKTSTDSTHHYEWYNYENKKWANAVTVNNTSREKYNNMAIGETIDIEDINSMWVWIPRFKYINNDGKIEVAFVSNDEEAYEAFTFDETSQSGFWITKFEAGIKEDSICIKEVLTDECNNQDQVLYFKPNIPQMNRITMANLFYSFRKMELTSNIYGFSGHGTSINPDGSINDDDNNIDIHMIRNSEWQAVAILSKSIYGNSKEVSFNDSIYTGKATYNNEEYNYDVNIYGTSASTTGNIYGVYDMAGGRREFVMFSNSENNLFIDTSNSGFNDAVNYSYYDKGLSASDKSLLILLNVGENLVNNEPMTRGGYRGFESNIFSMYGVSNYVDKISPETNSRAVLNILNGGNNDEEEEES